MTNKSVALAAVAHPSVFPLATDMQAKRRCDGASAG
jgi:hypothetical protein